MNIPVLIKQKGDAPFRSNAGDSYTMPARFYTDSSIYDAEKEAIFYRSWWYAGHASQLASPGQYITTKIHEQNLFVVRNREQELQAFYNVCQHRGHELLSGSGKTNVIVCPYHAWAYDFDGNLKAARNSENVEGFNACEFSLKSVQIEVFCGMVFVNLDPDAVPLKDQVPELEKEIRGICPDVDNLIVAQRDTYSVASNWKIMVDNFLECYHCHVAHRDFVDLVDMESYRSKVDGIYSSHISKGIRSADNTAFKLESSDVDFGYAGWFLWPNLTIWAYPGDPNLSILQMIPDGSDKTIEYQDWFLPTKKPSAQLKKAMDYQKDVLQPEDISLCESVQRGMNSKGYNQGRFIVDRELSELSEHAVHHFQKLVVDALGAGLGE
ncbi:MAG: aromatic ring-hydroxylating dioxygenase subunit alpha [Arenicellales bacterium]